MKFLLVFLFLISVASLAEAQSCGYTFLTIHITDPNGQSIKNAEIEMFDKDFQNRTRLDYPLTDDPYDRLRKNIAWSEEKAAYFGSEGMCGGHHGVGLRVSAKGFERVDKVIEMPLGATIYRIKLKRVGPRGSPKNADKVDQGLDRSVSITKLGEQDVSKLIGTIYDAQGSVIVGAYITAMDSDGNVFGAVTNDTGNYTLTLPVNRYKSRPGFKEARYDLTVQAHGFKTSVTRGFVFVPSQLGAMHFDVALQIGEIIDIIKIRDSL